MPVLYGMALNENQVGSRYKDCGFIPNRNSFHMLASFRRKGQTVADSVTGTHKGTIINLEHG